MGKVAIFGGTFNPVHWGHLLIAEAAVSQFSLDRVLWVPTYRPPHKSHALAEFHHRLAMVQQAIGDNPYFVANDLESRRSGLSYAIDTFQALQALQPQAEWYWIIGQDAFQSLPQWRGIEQLAAHCTWLVAPRTQEVAAPSPQHPVDPHPLPAIFDRSGRLRYHAIATPTVGLSSGLIRHACQQGKSIRYWVPDGVRHYIQQQRLFQGTAKSEGKVRD
jgi:nicotinate-nucleotide adenylyltransferase